MDVTVEISARHIHISEKDLEILFGEGAILTLRKALSQPGEFVSFQKVTVVGPRDKIEGISILGPTRSETQVEITLTEARKLGINAPVTQSGMLKGTPGCKLIGPKGEINITKGVIAAKRHLHLSPKDAQSLNIKDNQIVSVEVKTEERSLVFGDVVCRVREDFAAYMHIDTDESNAAGISGNIKGTVIV